MYKDHTVAVVVPAYNEAGFVGDVLDTVPAFVDRIYAVDDCSTDETWAEIVTHANRLNERQERETSLPYTDEEFARLVVPISHEKNRGVGGAIKTGYRRAHADGIDVTAVMNGDGQMDPAILDRIIEPIVSGRSDYVKGNRLLYPRYREQMSSWRFFGNSLLSVLTKAASGYWKLSDSQNGYTAISRRALDALDLDELYDGYGFLNHLLVHLNLREMRVSDVAMSASYGEEASGIRYSSFVPNLSALLLRSFLGRLKVKYLVFDFHPLVALYAVGSVGMAAGLLGIVGVGVAASSVTTALLGTGLFFLVTMVGGLTLTLATVQDMRQSEHLERQHYGLVPEEEIEPATDEAPLQGGAPRSWNR